MNAFVDVKRIIEVESDRPRGETYAANHDPPHMLHFI